MGQLIIAHRGASYDAPENTLAAFRLAFEQGADAIESDWHLTSDGQVACLHDADTERVAGKKLVAAKSTLQELQTLDVGKWKDPKYADERIITLADALAIVPPGKKIFIELKSKAEIVPPIAKIIANSSLKPEQIVIISFHADAVAKSKKLMPNIKAYWLCGFKKKKDGTPPPTVDEVAATIQKTRADGLDAEAVTDYVNADFIKRLNDLGCHDFSVWTVDDPAVAEFYKKLGAWSITTNRPGYLREELNKPNGK